MAFDARARADAIAAYAREHKLRAVGAFWAAGIASALAWERRRARGRAMSVKLIHARLYAQAATLTALCAAAHVEFDARAREATPDPHAYDGATRRRRRRDDDAVAADGAEG